MYRKNVVFIFFVSVLLFNSAGAMKHTRKEEPIMAITTLSKADLRRLESKPKKYKPILKKEPIVSSRKNKISLICPKRTCRYIAIKDEQIINHLKLHQFKKDNPHKYIYQCKKCDYLGKAKGVFKRHTKSHKSSKPYICTLCDKPLKYKDSLNRHMRTIHA